MKKSIYLISIIFLCLINEAFSQDGEKYINQKAKGGMLSFGLTYYALPENVTYRPLLLQGYFHKPLYKTKNFFNVSLDFLPQYNLVILNKQLDVEFGTNVYLDFGFQLSKSSILSLIIGSGPHFITVETSKQINGFIFSDTFLLAYKQKIDDNLELGIFSGYRHLSNASIKQPNNGIDNIMFGVCLAKVY
jgi:hypothetical protein